MFDTNNIIIYVYRSSARLSLQKRGAQKVRKGEKNGNYSKRMNSAEEPRGETGSKRRAGF